MRQTQQLQWGEQTLTVKEILARVNERRPYSRPGLLGLLVKIKVRPVGEIRTRPRRYPADTAERVLNALGEKVLTMTQLRSERSKARRVA